MSHSPFNIQALKVDTDFFVFLLGCGGYMVSNPVQAYLISGPIQVLVPKSCVALLQIVKTAKIGLVSSPNVHEQNSITVPLFLSMLLLWYCVEWQSVR